jgi:hypothetical protein
MTIPSEISRNDYTGNGVATVFAYTFRVFAADDLTVTLRSVAGVESTLVLGADYTVSGAGLAAGGNVTLTTAPASGAALTIRRIVETVQPTDLRNQGQFYAETHEDVFDRLTMIDQQQDGEISRSVRAAETDPVMARLPSVALRAGRVLGFDSVTGDPIAAEGGDFGVNSIAANTAIVNNAASSAPPTAVPVDDITVLADGSTARRDLSERFADTVNVKDFGAVGDGVTDDAAAIQAAVDTMEVGGGTLHIPAGTYLLGSEVLLLGEIIVQGDGYGSTFIKAADDFELGGRLFDTFRRDNITIQGIHFDGNVANQSGYVPATDNGQNAIIIRSSKNITIRNCYFKDFGKDGIFMFGTAPTKSNDQILIEGCVFENMYRNGFSIIEGQNITVANNFFFGLGDLTPAEVTLNEGVRIEADFSTEHVINLLISNNHFQNMQGGITAYNQNLSTVQRNIVIANNTFEEMTGRAGVALWRLKDQGASVIGNRFFNCGTTGADFSIGAGGGVSMSECDNVIVADNYFYDCGGDNGTVVAGGGGANSQIVNNVFVNDRRRAIHLYSVDIGVGASGTYRMICNNVCRNGGQDAANTYPAITVWGNNPGGGAAGGGDFIDGNTIETDTSDGYNAGISVGYDNGNSVLGTNIITGNGADYIFADVLPEREFEIAESGSAATTGALTGSLNYSIRAAFDLVTLDVGPSVGTVTNVAAITLGVVLPERFRPSATKYGFCLVQLNGALSTTVGIIQVGTDGIINIYRDAAQTPWGTTANTGFIGAVVSYVR